MIILLAMTIVAYMINGLLGFVLQSITLLYYVKGSLNKNSYIMEILVGMLIISIPTSFINIFGGEYGGLPLSLYNLILLLLTAYAIRLIIRKNISLKWNTLNKMTLLVMVTFIVPILTSVDKIDAIKNYLTSFFPLVIILLLSTLDNLKINYKRIEKLYLYATVSTAIAVLFQIFLSKIVGIDIGTIGYFDDSRIGFRIIFADYSFLSLYLMTGASLYIINFLNEKKYIDLSLGLVTIVASILTTSRTGIVAFVGGILMYVLWKIFTSNKDIRHKYIKIIPYLICCTLIGIVIIMKLRPEQSIFSGSGRLKEYLLGIEIFIENPILGIGLGRNSFLIYAEQIFGITKYAVPHNFFIMMLVQSGLLGTIVISIFILKILSISIKKDALFTSIMTTLIGAQFIPDILSSRFIFVQIILILVCISKYNESTSLNHNNNS